MKTGCMRAAGRMTDTRTPPNPRSDARPEPRRRARKTTHPVVRGGRGGVVSPYGQPSRESTPPYAAINAASPAAECAHDASVSHRSLIQAFAIPAAYARRGGPHRHRHGQHEQDQRPRTAAHPNRAATRLGIPVSTLARWRSERRELPYVTVGRLIRYRQSDLDRWIEDNTVYPEK